MSSVTNCLSHGFGSSGGGAAEHPDPSAAAPIAGPSNSPVMTEATIFRRMRSFGRGPAMALSFNHRSPFRPTFLSAGRRKGPPCDGSVTLEGHRVVEPVELALDLVALFV